VGLDPLRDILDYLGPRLDAALAELDCTLDCLISEKAIEPADALTIGLAVLAMLADLCRTAGASVLVPR